VIPSLSIAQTDAIKTALGGGAVSTRLYRPFAPTRDGTIDNTVVAHEWGHYISNRLVGDGNGLGNVQGRGMGEGWGDFHALLLMVRPEDSAVPSNSTFQGVYAVTAYVTGGTTALGAGNEGFFFGIRRYPYSTDLTKNPLTFQHISSAVALPPGVPQSGRGSANNAEVHNVGEVWANALWECYASILRDTLGGAPRLTFNQAQQRMKDYIVAGYKLTPADPALSRRATRSDHDRRERPRGLFAVLAGLRAGEWACAPWRPTAIRPTTRASSRKPPGTTRRRLRRARRGREPLRRGRCRRRRRERDLDDHAPERRDRGSVRHLGDHLVDEPRADVPLRPDARFPAVAAHADDDRGPSRPHLRGRHDPAGRLPDRVPRRGLHDSRRPPGDGLVRGQHGRATGDHEDR
jgi:hypothetical protein